MPGEPHPVHHPGRRLDASRRCACELHIEPGPAGTIAVLRVAGEIDRLTIPVVDAALGEAMDRRPADLVVDLSAVRFCCVRGFSLLATAARAAQERGIGWGVSGMTPHLRRVADMVWPRRVDVHYRSVAAAVTAIRIAQASRTAR
jgi:anti-anti-sigma factor